MRNDYNEIEERLQDFLEFEHEVTLDIWDNIESGLTLDNSVGALADFEFDVTDDIWQEIEDRLAVKRPKAAIWWLPGVAASLLLTLLAWYNIDELQLNQDEHQSAVAVNSENNGEEGVVNTANSSKVSNTYDLNKSSSTNQASQSLLSSTETNSQNSYNDDNHNESISNASKTGGNGFLAYGGSSMNSTNAATSQANSASNNNVTNGDLNSNARVANTHEGGQIIFIEDENSTVELTDGANNLEVISNVSEKEIVSEEGISKDLQPSSMLPIAMITKEEIESEQEGMDEIPVEEIELTDGEEEDEEEKKTKKWQLIALGGIGNLAAIKETFDVGGLPPNPNDKNAPQNFEPVVIDGKEGMNSISYSVPINLSLNGQRMITDGFAVRLGVNYTQLKNNFQIYQEDYAVKLNYVAVPITGVITLKQWDKLKWNALLNTRSEKLVSHRFVQSPELTYYLPEEIEVNNDGLNILVGLGSELNISLTENLSLTLNGQVNRYLQNDSQQEYIRAKQKLWPEFNLGLSQNF